MTIYIEQPSKNLFDKFLLDTLYQIANYLKLEIYSDP